ncbi:hypothetical protein OG884_04035 [Streptosporangium sp. NBC_01755]|uniref:hypothetical protein n=1 Tax=Streptosporangium sp. NBC_01755 TaxID=2975949 RepID=UPI002DD8F431|nr:hypothetical protein [Streptosporangium sp. NBC_01755]WSD01116.1 hypothetical protein OG884_04035 [Streptosporangium sp. NBC_01755]
MRRLLGHGIRAFLVRVYVEPREVPGAVPRLAAWVQDLRTGDGHYVRTMDEIEAFIRQALQESGADVSDWWPA